MAHHSCLIAKALKFVPARAFEGHKYIEEVECHDGVEKIEEHAFDYCPRLKRVIMPGVKVIEYRAFHNCQVLTYIECGKLERIGASAFSHNKSLSSIDLPSIRNVEGWAFACCINLKSVVFGKDLESIRGWGALHDCVSLERITLPSKDGMIIDDSSFSLCGNLNQVDLVGGLHEKTIAALLMEEWKSDMIEEIDSINQILPNTSAGNKHYGVGEKAREIRRWIRSVLGKIVRYQAEHDRVLNEAATTLQLALPRDIVMNGVLPFLELPLHTFEVEDASDEEEGDSEEGGGYADDDQGDKSRHLFCCLRKLWSHAR